MAIYLIVGGSRGIGGATAQHLVKEEHTVLAVSRTPAAAGTWIEADVATEEGLSEAVEAISKTLEETTEYKGLDGLLFLGGVWENGAFAEAYDFLASQPEETRFLLSVNLTAPILLAQRLAPYLSKAANPRIILNGAQFGLPNAATKEVANTATKFGMQ